MRGATLSGLGHIAACPGSASLPRFQRANTAASLGTAIHELIANLITHGAGSLVAALDPSMMAARYGLAADDAGRLAFLAAHLSLPVPAGALAEVPLGYFPDGSVRRIEGGAGEYPDVGQLLSGTLDAMWAEPGGFFYGDEFQSDPPRAAERTLWIVDWKTGDETHVPPPDRNWQLRAGAVMAAMWTGAQRVIPAICYVNAAECAEAVRAGVKYEGRWEVGAPLDAAALDAIEAEMCAVLARARGEDDGESGQDRVGRVRLHDPSSGVLPLVCLLWHVYG
jgi:hypothetical protein